MSWAANTSRPPRAKGMAEKIVVIKHAVRVAINPLISLLGMQFPEISPRRHHRHRAGAAHHRPPRSLLCLQAQDVYVASAILMLLSVLLVLGNLSPTCCWHGSTRAYVLTNAFECH